MAAAWLGKRKTAPPRRRQPRYGRKTPAKRRKAPEKRRRRPARRQPARKRGKKPSPASQEATMLRWLQRDDRRLSSKAKGLMVSFINDIYRKVSTEAEQLRRQSRRPTIGPSQVQAALREVMPRKRVRRSATPVPKRSH